LLVIGCTGGIGSGKSTVARLLARRGAQVIDTDALARAALLPDGAGYGATVARFGDTVRKENGELDRAALAAIVFGDEAARRDLEAIVHPIVEAQVHAQLARARQLGRVVVIDIPLLVETAARGRYALDGVLVVEAPLEVAVERVVRERGLAPDDVRARAAAQANATERMRAADFVILNEGTFAELEEMTARAWAWIERLLREAGEEFSGGTESRD
jgi:dephospho-CoA kinase